MQVFQFKQFAVDHTKCGMPVSTDGILLGAWAPLPEKGHIIDIGTGSGLLALMSAQRCPEAKISAIELDAEAAEQATKNALNSPWSRRITVYHQDIRYWMNSNHNQTSGSIICNPPYFNSGETSIKAGRAVARHTEHFSHQDLLTCIAAMLRPRDEAHLILPKVEGEQLLTSLPEHALFCVRRCDVKTTIRKPVSRLLLSLSPTEMSCDVSQLIIHEGDGYSDAFTALTWPFYLNMTSPDHQSTKIDIDSSDDPVS
ncbi:tRNA1(Val) (adenine(37)-N6)-methyltransferase [Thaumasiovibrio subtropicus]|uniref:tRNA1(Val) (adenine(37)-N6)-methyltransferase n=1 Tax=Thaumasiovibrio subtropicus TaxID=1891207 RepID=UPI000B361E1A|nr:methyltransferase [Thaumasiovibrio subtropicus]